LECYRHGQHPVKSTIRSSNCPVSISFFLSLTLAVLFLFPPAGCGTPEEEPEGPREPVDDAVSEYVTPMLSGDFILSESPPDTVIMRWTGQGKATLKAVYTMPGSRVALGDTLFLVEQYITAVEIERLEMELQLKSGMLSFGGGDSLLAQTVDSLSLLLDSLAGIPGEYLHSPVSGLLTGINVREEQELVPGDTLAFLAVPEENVRLVQPPEGSRLTFWPEGDSLVKLVEAFGDHAVYSGDPQGISMYFRAVRSVPRQSVFEDDLNSYLITDEYDTIYVSRLGQDDGGLIMVLPEREITSNIITWTGSQ